MNSNINFFEENVFFKNLNNKCFGIVDDESNPEQPSFIDLENKDIWNCKINNPLEKNINFYPLDKVISILEKDNNKVKCCDVMLTVDDKQLILIELKNKRKSKDVISTAIEQLKSSIYCLKTFHNIERWYKLLAYISNRKHPNFAYSYKDICQKFRSDTGFRLLITWQVDIK